ncbi:CHRD domain-containing protein [Enterovibrio norvegicus]|uniref:CHRD domain-containing protein n=1 Tax=Enterovibrio norvegicus TaxID=188144 RepID=UPI00352EF58A
MKYIAAAVALTTLVACNDDDNNTVTPSSPDFTATKTYALMLTGQQAVPMNDSTRSGSSTIDVDESAKQLKATLDTSNFSDFTAAHIHAGDIGSTGAVVFPFGTPDSNGMASIDASDLTDEQLQTLLSGDWYINLHTSTVPSGEVRAQIVPDTTTIYTFEVDGSQEVPAVTTSASGDGYAEYNSENQTLSLRVNTEEIDDATAAHIHIGEVGSNGGVLVVLDQDATDAGVWTTPANTELDAATLATLNAGGYYTNFHTPGTPSGEIRGQITTNQQVLFTFPIDGSQEVPAVTTSAQGNGYALLNTETGALTLKAITEGVSDATAAHIHIGVSGANGGVLVGLEQDSGDVNSWQTPANTVLDAGQQTTFIEGGNYVNVHTPANAAGEIRGQIIE